MIFIKIQFHSNQIEPSKVITTSRPQTSNNNNINTEDQQPPEQQVNEAPNESNDYSDQNKPDIDSDMILSRPWYFSNGERYPKPARINKKTNKRLAKLTPAEDVRGDRITNQLMFVPPNYEELKNEGKLKTILLYNGLGPWNVKQGKNFRH